MTKRQKEQNDRFNALPHNKQRVEIAKDVLKWLALGRIKAGAGSYIFIRNAKARIDRKENPEGSFQDLVKRDSFTCDVCAKGALFVCAVARKDKVKNNQMRGFNGNELSAKLGGVFSPEQLALIEAEFEGNVIDTDIIYDYTFIPSIDRGLSDRMRLKAIMQNIIKNNGTFKPVAKK